MKIRALFVFLTTASLSLFVLAPAFTARADNARSLDGVGDDYQPLDARQKEIANTVVDKLVERIKALKPKYPELEKFGDSPYFTRGDGEFRYDYKIEKVMVNGKPQARALPGGCGIYFRLYALDAPMSDWTDYYGWASTGGDRAGITSELAIAIHRKSASENSHADSMNEKQISLPGRTINFVGGGRATDPRMDLSEVILNAEQKEMDTTFAQLTSEYLLSKKGFALDTPSLLDAAENRDAGIGKDALTALRFRALSPDQLARLRQSFHDGKIPVGNAWIGIQIIEEKDHSDLPAFLSDLVTISLETEQAGEDTFQRTPFFGEPWSSDARTVRLSVLGALQDGDPADLDPAGKILAADTALENRIQALAYVSTQPGAAAQKLLIGPLQNSFRSIQVEAAQECGQQKIMSAVDGLRLLLGSSSAKVRTAAAQALGQLGQAVPNPVPVPPLPDSARAIAAALWAHGLNDEDFLVVHALPWPDAALMPSLDANTLKITVKAYVFPKDKFEFPWAHTTPPGPFLLAAAIKFKQDDLARQIYGRMCDQFESDDEAQAAGMSALGWDRFSVALNEFHSRNDQAAASQFPQVIAFSDVARPFTLLSIYVKQSTELLHYLQTKLPEKETPEPAPSDTADYVNYWIGRLKDCDGEHPSEAGEKIRALGLRAMPMLIDAITDKTPTRNFSYGRSYLPQRDLVYVGDAAKNIIFVIGHDYGLKPPGFQQGDNFAQAELQEKLRAWLKTIPADATPLPPGKRERRLLHPAGEYDWGDD